MKSLGFSAACFAALYCSPERLIVLRNGWRSSCNGPGLPPGLRIVASRQAAGRQCHRAGPAGAALRLTAGPLNKRVSTVTQLGGFAFSFLPLHGLSRWLSMYDMSLLPVTIGAGITPKKR